MPVLWYFLNGFLAVPRVRYLERGTRYLPAARLSSLTEAERVERYERTARALEVKGISNELMPESGAKGRESALSWLARATGAGIAYSGSVPVEDEFDASDGEPPKVLSYVNGPAETDPSSRNNYVDLKPSPNGESPFAYFMDGSRMAWKIAEFRHGGKLWPVVRYQKFLITDIIRNPALSGISDAA